MRSKYGRWWLAALLVLTPALAFGQVDTSGTQAAPPAPVGSGARAMGTGGAYIAIADDATAANWNPAGLIQLVKPEVSFAADYEERRLPGDSSLFGNVNSISGVLPFHIGEVNMVLSANYQRRWDFYFDTDWSTNVDRTGVTDAEILVIDGGPAGEDGIVNTRTNDVFGVSGVTRKVGSLEALSPAYAIQVTPTFSLGFTYNFWSDRWLSPGYTQEYREHQTTGTTTITQRTGWYEMGPDCRCVDGSNNPGPCDDTTYTYIKNPECLSLVEIVDDSAVGVLPRAAVSVRTEEDIEMQGQNFNVGFLWKITPRWSLGGVYRSEFEVDMDRTAVYKQLAPTLIKYKWSDSLTLRLPASYGLGGAFRYNDQFSVAADVSFIEWSRYQITYPHDLKISPVNGMPIDIADIDTTVTARIGGEYLIMAPKYIVPVRAGVFYDPEPARGESDPFYGFAVGTGLVYEPVVLDLSYWYRFGNDVTLYSNYNKMTGEVDEVTGDLHRQMIMLSAVVHLK